MSLSLQRSKNKLTTWWRCFVIGPSSYIFRFESHSLVARALKWRITFTCITTIYLKCWDVQFKYIIVGCSWPPSPLHRWPLPSVWPLPSCKEAFIILQTISARLLTSRTVTPLWLRLSNDRPTLQKCSIWHLNRGRRPICHLQRPDG